MGSVISDRICLPLGCFGFTASCLRRRLALIRSGQEAFGISWIVMLVVDPIAVRGHMGPHPNLCEDGFVFRLYLNYVLDVLSSGLCCGDCFSDFVSRSVSFLLAALGPDLHPGLPVAGIKIQRWCSRSSLTAWGRQGGTSYFVRERLVIAWEAMMKLREGRVMSCDGV